MTCAIGAELLNVTRRRLARRRRSSPKSSALLKHRVLFFRDQDLTRAEHVPSRAASASWRTTPSLGSDPEHPGPGPHLQGPDSPPSTTRTPSTATRPGARPADGLRCCAASSARRSAATRSGSTWSRPTSACPSTSRPRSPAARQAQHRVDLRRRHADREAPRAARRNTPTRSTRWCAPIPRPARRSCSSTPSRPTSRTTTAENVRFGLDYSPGGAELLNYLISQAATPSTRCVGAGSRTASRSGTTAAPSTTPSRTTPLPTARWSAPAIVGEPV